MKSPIGTLSPLLLVPGLCLGQVQTQGAPTPGAYTPPPLVNAPPAPDAPGAPPADQGAPTPVPPGYDSPPPGYRAPTGQYAPPPSGYPYSPYGQPYIPSGKIETGPEVGLMITESLFGALTAATTGLLGYYLLLKPLQNSASIDSTISNLLFVVVFSAVPLSVSQTELSLANGSRYYYSESWPSLLSGLVAQAAVVGLYYWVRPSMIDGGEAVLLIGTIGFVPLAEMVMINLTKTPRYKLPSGGFNYRAALNFDPTDGALHAAVPVPQPILAQTPQGLSAGVGFSLLAGKF